MEQNLSDGALANRRVRLFLGKVARAILCLLPLQLSADTIHLKSGQTVTGTWIGATNREVRIAVGDSEQKIAISDIARIDFGDSASSAAPLASDVPVIPDKPDLANKQGKFCDVVAGYRADVMRVINEPNPIVRAGLHKPNPAEYNGRLAAILGKSGQFDSWRGTIRFSVAGSWAVVEFTPDCKPPQGVAFATARSAQTAGGTQTLIPLNSPIARSLSRLKANDSVVASGHLLYTGGKSFYQGSPDNPNPSAASPRYLAVFTVVTAGSK